MVATPDLARDHLVLVMLRRVVEDVLGPSTQTLARGRSGSKLTTVAGDSDPVGIIKNAIVVFKIVQTIVNANLTLN